MHEIGGKKDGKNCLTPQAFVVTKGASYIM
jgi:hypothetical protein